MYIYIYIYIYIYNRTGWDQVAQALWKRYPNPYSKHVLSEDLVSRYVQCINIYEMFVTRVLLQIYRRQQIDQ